MPREAAADNIFAFSQAQPRYLVVAKLVAAEIARGDVAPGDRLPGERDLCRHFDVSRVTVRRALAILSDRGLVEADGTRGWFVTSTALGEPNALMSFSEMARSRGLTPSSRVRRRVVRPATIDEAEAFGIAPGTDLFDLERIRLLNGVAVAIECSRIPLFLAPSLPQADLEQGSLYETLRSMGVQPIRADYVLQAISAEPQQAAALGLQQGAPLLMANAKTYDIAGKPVELSSNVYRGDRYRFRATLFRAGRDGGL